jgi:hypothetical protein
MTIEKAQQLAADIRKLHMPDIRETKVLPPVSGSGEPEWAAQCRRCANLKSSMGGRHWRCRAIKVPSPHGGNIGWVADARRAGGICGPEGKAFLPNTELSSGHVA